MKPALLIILSFAITIFIIKGAAYLFHLNFWILFSIPSGACMFFIYWGIVFDQWENDDEQKKGRKVGIEVKKPTSSPIIILKV